MKNLIILFISSLFLSPLCGQELKVATDKATVNFFFHGDKVDGTVEGFEATISFDPSNPSLAKFKGSVDVNTLDTGIKMRDKHLKSKDFFEADTYPKMTFESTEISVEGDVITIKGNLTIKGTKRTETFTLKMEDNTLVLTTLINTADYDVMTKKQREKTNVDITIRIPVG